MVIHAMTTTRATKIAGGKREVAIASVPRASHGDPDNPLMIGDVEIPCYVLEDGRRILTQKGMMDAIGIANGGAREIRGERLARFVGSERLKPFVGDKLQEVSDSLVVFRTPSGQKAYGYEASILIDLCNAILSARKAGVLQKQQMHIADQCELMIRGFARVGLIALIDETTGYQGARDKAALRGILDTYLREEFAAWAKRFPDDFYRQIFRLRGWRWKGMKVNRPQCVAHFTNDLVYSRLAHGILEELRDRNPKSEDGTRAAMHHQWLTPDIGHAALSQHLHAVTSLMKAADTWDDMVRMVNRAFPKKGNKLQVTLFSTEGDDE